MAYVNLPANLQDMFYALSDRVTKLETGPSGPQDTADYASTTAQAAYTQAINAGIQATAASLQAGVALQSADGKNVVHYQTSGPTGGGITGDVWFQVNGTGVVQYQYIYNGSSWINSPITDTVIASLDAGKITTGTLTSIAIYAGSSGQFQVSSAGALTATAATIQGTITSSNGTIGGWSISSTQLYSGSTYMSSATGVIYAAGSLQTNGNVIAGSGLTVSSGASTFNGYINANSFLYNAGYALTTGSANMRINTSSGLIAYTSSSERYKVKIEPQAIPNESVLSLIAKSYVDKAEYEANNNSDVGLQRWIGLIAEDIAQLPVLKDLLVEYNDKGEPNSVYYDRIAVALIPLLQDHETRLAKLEGK
jgi:hypothetical protein